MVSRYMETDDSFLGHPTLVLFLLGTNSRASIASTIIAILFVVPLRYCIQKPTQGVIVGLCSLFISSVLEIVDYGNDPAKPWRNDRGREIVGEQYRLAAQSLVETRSLLGNKSWAGSSRSYNSPFHPVRELESEGLIEVVFVRRYKIERNAIEPQSSHQVVKHRLGTPHLSGEDEVP